VRFYDQVYVLVRCIPRGHVVTYGRISISDSQVAVGQRCLLEAEGVVFCPP